MPSGGAALILAFVGLVAAAAAVVLLGSLALLAYVDCGGGRRDALRYEVIPDPDSAIIVGP